MGESEIADKLIADIQAGNYVPNEKLPSENELSERYKIPRITVRKAYERLQELGYIYSRQGKGSFVKDSKKQIPLILSGHESFSRKMIEQGYDFESKNMFCEEIEYNKSIFDSLGVDEACRVFKVGRLRLVDQRPIALHISYVAEVVFADIQAEGRGISSMFDYYRSKGYQEFRSKPSTLSVIFPSRFEREALECSSLVPLLVLESGCLDFGSGKVLDHARILYRSDCFTYMIGSTASSS